MPFIPPPEDTIPSKYNDLLRRVKALETANPLQNATIHKGGIQIVDGGSVRVIDSDGHVVGIIGALPSPLYDRADGSPQPGLAFYREDGTLAALLADQNPLVAPYKQAWEIFDRSGNGVMSDDTNSGTGLARPYIPAGVFADLTAPTNTTTSATFAGLQWADTFQQHPKVTASVLVQSSAGTTGEVRITVSGQQIGAVISVAAASFAQMTVLAAAWPAGTYVQHARTVVQLEARRTAGTGTIGVRGLGLWGVQS